MNVFYKYSCHIIEQMEDLKTQRRRFVYLLAAKMADVLTGGRRGEEDLREKMERV